MERAVQEFKAQTAALGARGEGPGKRSNGSGPKLAWHGRVFENLRNDIFDAVPHEIVQRGGEKSLLRRNQFGFNVTGPVLIPKIVKPRPGTYFSFSFEGVRERISRTALRTLPTEAQRGGDFSQTVDAAGDLLPIYDPATTAPNPAYDPSRSVSTDNLQYLRAPFAGNRIPANRLNSVALDATRMFPEPNASVGPFLQNNYFINSPETNVANGIIARLDHAINDNHRVTMDLNYSNGLLGAAQYYPNAANPGPVDNSSSNRRAAAEYVYTASPQTVNTVSFEASSDQLQSGDPGQLYPDYTVAGYLGLGRAYPLSTNSRNTYSLNDGLSLRKGAHSIRLGAQYVFYEVNSRWGRYPDGYWRFGQGLTSLPGIVNTGDGFASFLLGAPEYAEQTYVTSPSYFRRDYAGFSARDRYEVRKDFVLSFALGVSRHSPRVEKYDRQSTVDMSEINPANDRAGALAFAGLNGQDRGFRPVIWAADPSFSFSWTPGSTKAVVRGSFARSHGPVPLYFGQFGTQGFNGVQSFISPNVQINSALPLAASLPPPATPYPDLRPEAANNTTAELIDASTLEPTYQSANLSVEKELPGSLVLTLGAGYAGGKNLLVGNGTANPDAPSPDVLVYRDQLNDELFFRSLTPFPQYKGFDLGGLYPYSRYQRDAAYVRLEKRLSQGVSFSAYYEYSKQMDDYSGPYGAQDYTNRDNEWSLTSWNRPQRVQFSYAYELPFGANKPFLNYTDWRRQLIDGWSLSGSGMVLSGAPLAFHALFNNTGGVVPALRVNPVPGVDPTVPEQGPSLWFNPAAFDQPPDFTLGTLSRTHPFLRGPISQNYDLSVSKRIPIDAERVVEFSAAAFNFLNHANWNDPDTTIGPESSPNLNAGKIIGSTGGRVIQVGLRLSF